MFNLLCLVSIRTCPFVFCVCVCVCHVSSATPRPIGSHVPSVLQISAVGIVSIAIVINQKFYRWSNFISSELFSTPQVLMLIGFGVLLIAVIGLCGVLRDSGCLLTLVNYIPSKPHGYPIRFVPIVCHTPEYDPLFCSFLFCLRSSWSENWYCPELFITCAETSNSMRWIKWMLPCPCTTKPTRRPPLGTCYSRT